MSDIIRPQPGPQTAFLASKADICIYGGSAGSGSRFTLTGSDTQTFPIQDRLAFDDGLELSSDPKSLVLRVIMPMRQ